MSEFRILIQTRVPQPNYSNVKGKACANKIVPDQPALLHELSDQGLFFAVFR